VLFAGAALYDLGSVRADDRAGFDERAGAALRAAGEAPAVTGTIPQIDTIAVVARWLHRGKARRRGEALRLDRLTTVGGLAAALAACAAGVAKQKRGAVDEGIAEQEIHIACP
jgi:hypothetical protein